MSLFVGVMVRDPSGEALCLQADAQKPLESYRALSLNSMHMMDDVHQDSSECKIIVAVCKSELRFVYRSLVIACIDSFANHECIVYFCGARIERIVYFCVACSACLFM